MATLNSIDFLISNTYGTGGTNKPSGFKAGDFLIPGQVNRGVAITNTFPSFIKVIPETTILTVTFTSSTPTTASINLLNAVVAPRTRIVNFAESELALELESPTLVTASANNAGYSINFSGYDQWEQKTFSSQVSSGSGNVATSNVCFKYFTNITVTLNAPLTGDDTNTITIKIGGNVELPYTDYGNSNFLLNVIDSTEAASNIPFITMDSPTSPDFTATNAFSYTTANWTTPITASSGTPRPIIIPNIESTNSILLFSQQIVYPTNELPNLKATPVVFSEDNLTNVIGIKNYTDGWQPWTGGIL